jgi:hypothetical protein
VGERALRVTIVGLLTACVVLGAALVTGSGVAGTSRPVITQPADVIDAVPAPSGYPPGPTLAPPGPITPNLDRHARRETITP